MNKDFSGVGVWIWNWWNCDRGDFNSILARCKNYNISYVIIKCVDGRNWFFKDFTESVVNTFHEHGIKVYGWGYHYGGTTLDEEIRLAGVALNTVKVDGYVIDAEAEFAGHGDWADKQAREIKALSGGKPVAMSSYGVPGLHGNFPFNEFLRYCDYFMPQAYYNAWRKEPEDGINWAYQSWLKMAIQKPIIPTLPAYTYGDYVCTADRNKRGIEYCKGYGGVNFWSYEHISEDGWNGIREGANCFHPVVAPTPQPEPVVVVEQTPAPIGSDQPIMWSVTLNGSVVIQTVDGGSAKVFFDQKKNDTQPGLLELRQGDVVIDSFNIVAPVEYVDVPTENIPTPLDLAHLEITALKQRLQDALTKIQELQGIIDANNYAMAQTTNGLAGQIGSLLTKIFKLIKK